MATQKKQGKVESRGLTGLERLGLRVSEMINSPIAQVQRWVTIHRLDTDGDQEWEEVMSLLSETDELEMIFNDDETVTIRWERQVENDCFVEAEELTALGEAPF